jgi:hypothetical protein
VKANLDNVIFFDETGLKIQIKSLQRDFAEHSAPGLDGIISIDMGRRGRKIIQSGILRGASIAALNEIISAVENLFDGQGHTLHCSDESFENVRIDSFETGPAGTGAAGAGCEYKIVYTQTGI